MTSRYCADVRIIDNFLNMLFILHNLPLTRLRKLLFYFEFKFADCIVSSKLRNSSNRTDDLKFSIVDYPQFDDDCQYAIVYYVCIVRVLTIVEGLTEAISSIPTAYKDTVSTNLALISISYFIRIWSPLAYKHSR